MKKRNRKLVSILLTLALLATLLVPMATPAAAATTYGTLGAPTVVPPATANLGTITITIDTLGAGTHSALITLPTDFAVNKTTTPPVFSVAKSTPAGSTVTGVVYAGYADNEFRIDLVQTGVATDVLLTVSLPSITVPSDADGEIKATITGLGGQFGGGSLVVGKAGSGALTLSVNDTVTITEAGTGANAFSMNIAENAQYALKREAGSLKLTLPKGFTWNTSAYTLTRVNDSNDVTILAQPIAVTAASNNSRTLVINRDANNTTSKSIFRLTCGINVDTAEATLGDINVTVGGTSSYSPSEFSMGTYKEYGVTVTAKSVESVKAGRIDQKLGKIEIKENSADSLPTSRTVVMELPVGAKWASLTVTPSGGGLTASTPIAVGTDGRTAKFTVTNAAAGGSGTITIENAYVDLAVDFKSDVEVKFSGSAGIADTVKVGESAGVITASADTPEVKIGVRGASAGDVTIVENKKEAFKSGKNIVLIAAAGVEWTSLPTVEVTEGDISLGIKSMTKSGRYLTIPVTSQSSKASTIKISNVKFTIDRTVPEGSMPLAIRGNAIDEVNDGVVTVGLIRAFYAAPTVASPMIFPQNENAAVVYNAKCVTPSPVEQTSNAAFVIGSTTFKLGGVEQTMDVAPYIKDGRTYLPIRYVAQALGVADANIMWDQATKKVTLIKGTTFAQLTIGSNILMVNGMPITMDVAPEISSDRTCLPIRFVAQVLGANVGWDEATQTVTIK